MSESETTKWARSLLQRYPDITELLNLTKNQHEAETMGKLFARFVLARGIRIPDDVDFEIAFRKVLEEIEQKKRNRPPDPPGIG
jgi:hypothetical protein